MKRIVFVLFFVMASVQGHAEAVKVSFAPDGSMLRGGKPYFIKGAGGENNLDELVKRGGNSFRTWTEGGLAGQLDNANALGLTVCAGIWLEKECNWFSYHKPEHCERQLERVRKTIRQHRDHPALLLWGLGNEIEGDGNDEAMWQQLNRLAQMVHEEDPAHPTFTAVAGLSPPKAAGLIKHTPDLDIVGINTYGGLFSLRQHLEKVGWTKPWFLSEFGPQGFWESPKTKWNAPLEPTSTQKAAMIRNCYEKAITPGGPCAGGYIFLWGEKQEATSTWFGVFLKTGETVATADLMQELWSGKAPDNRAPILKSFKCSTTTINPSETFTANVEASDPDGDKLEVRWEIINDTQRLDAKGSEIPPTPLDGLIQSEGPSAAIKAPEKAGSYRVFVYVTDGKGHAATANVPVQVK